MVQRKTKLCFDPSDDYCLIGITTSLPDYLLVFRLNRRLKWNMKRLGMFQVHGIDELQWFFLYYYQPDEYTEYFFAGNAQPAHWMAEPNLMIVKGACRPDVFQKIMTDCGATDDVFLADDYTHLINSTIDKSDSRRKKTIQRIAGILYDLELFMMDFSKRQKPLQPTNESSTKNGKEPRYYTKTL